MRKALAGSMVITMGLCICAAVVLFGAVTPDFAAPAYALGLVLALMWAAKLFFADVVSWKYSPIHLPVLAFVAYSIVRYFFSPIEYESRLEVINTCFCALVYFIAAANFYRPRDRAWFLWAVLLLALCEAVLAMWQFTSHSRMLFGYERADQYLNRGGGTYICPNNLAGFLEIILGLLLGRLVFYRTSTLSVQQLALRKIVFGYGALIVLAGLIITLSRGGWIAASVAIFSLVFWGSWELRRLWIRISVTLVALATLAAFSFGMGPVNDYIKVTFSGRDKDQASTVKDPTLGGRVLMWKATTDVIREHLFFGTGPMTWQWFHTRHLHPTMQARAEHAHSDYLQYTSDYGIVGAVLIGWIIISFFRQARILAREESSADQRSFAVGAGIATTAILVHSFFDFNMHIFATALLLATIFGFTAAADDPKRRYKRAELGKIPRFALGTALVALCALGVWIVGPTSLAARYTFLGNGAKAILDWDEAERCYERAIKLDPKSWEPYGKLGDLYRGRAEFLISFPLEERKQLAGKAVGYYEKALTLNALQTDLLMRQARACEFVGNNQQAMKNYDRALDLDPNNSSTYLYYGRFYRNTGDNKKALEMYKRSNELNWWSDQVARINIEELSAPPPSPAQ